MTISQPFSWTTKFKCDVLISFAIATLPFSIYLHLLFDQTNVNTIELLGFNYTHRFPDTSTFIWMLLIRLTPLIFYCIWFFVSTYWWRYFIIIPISINIYSIAVDCLNNPMSNEYDNDILILCSLLFFIGSLILFDNYIFKRYRIKGLNDLVNSSIDQRRLFENLKKEWLKIKSTNDSKTGDEYFVMLLHLKKVIKMKFESFIYLDNNSFIKYVRLREVLIIVILISCSFVLFSHKLVPKTQTSLNLLWMTLDDNGFYEMKSYIWYMSVKIGVIIPLAIWFYTSKNWWRYALLSPIILYSYQVWEANQDIQHLDAFGNIKAFPAIVSVVVILVTLSNIFKYRYGLLDMHDQLEKELDQFIEKTATNRLFILKEYKSLNIGKEENQDEEKYLQKLNDIKQRIQFELGGNS